jgi:hypothetical protein
MAEFIFLMHNDSSRALLTEDDGAWEPYIRRLQDLGCFRGGSSTGGGACFKKTGGSGPTKHIVGFIRVDADDLAAAQDLLAGNPVYEAGGTVEIRELTRD